MLIFTEDRQWAFNICIEYYDRSSEDYPEYDGPKLHIWRKVERDVKDTVELVRGEFYVLHHATDALDLYCRFGLDSWE